jgi:hypothetical protein
VFGEVGDGDAETTGQADLGSDVAGHGDSFAEADRADGAARERSPLI